MDVLLELAAMGNLPDVEAAIINELAEPHQERFLRATKYDRLNLDNLTDEECINNFRFRREHLNRLANCLNLPAYIISGDRHRTTRIEGLCMYLRRLAYPNRLTDLEPLFGISAEYISVITNQVMQHIIGNKGHLLYDLTNLNWLNRNRLEYYANAVANKNAPLRNCWGFIDGTARGICRPIRNQQDYFSGHKRMHCVKYQSVLCPDGIITSLTGPFVGRRHDAGILRDSNIYQQLQQHAVFGPES